LHRSSLQKISATFAGCGDTRRNDSNDICIPVTVSNDQQAPFAVGANSDPALFVMVVVLDRQCSFVVKDQFGLGEADALVLEFVGCVLAFVVLNFN
jgi:hypothetical protein